MTNSPSPSRAAFVDAHAHLYDSRVISYGIFERKDPIFEALVGDYSISPSNQIEEGGRRCLA